MVLQSSQDERKALRRLISSPVRCAIGARQWEAHLLDLSASGGFVESSALPAAGSTVQLDFTLPFRSRGVRVHFVLEGRVQRCVNPDDRSAPLEPCGFGIQFASLSPQERACLESIVAEGGSV